MPWTPNLKEGLVEDAILLVRCILSKDDDDDDDDDDDIHNLLIWRY